MYSLTLLSCILFQAFAWEQIPNIPSGHRAQFYILQKDGSYKYGYDAGNGNSAKQTADPSNQVEGHYFYTSPSGQKLDLKYSAGIQGFVPVGLEKLLTPQSTNNGAYQFSSPAYARVQSYPTYEQAKDASFTKSDDGSYSFGFTSNSHQRSEQADANGNVRGRYSYSNPEGVHDLSYVAGSATGFLPTGGSLVAPPGLTKAQLRSASGRLELDDEGEGLTPGPNIPEPDNREVPNNSADESGDDDGSGEYKPDNSGEYVPDNSGEYTPDDSGEYQPGNEESDNSGELRNHQNQQSGDASYVFSIDTNSYKRNEAADGNGNVKGRYSFVNSQGTHDLQYEAGAEKGFVAKSGSLSVPNGLVNGEQKWQAARNFQSSAPTAFVNSNDGSYSFGFSSDDQERSEQGDANGNVRGRYSYQNAAGSHDLSYVAGASTGFMPTGGNLIPAPGLTNDQLRADYKNFAAPAVPAATARQQYTPFYGIGNAKIVSYVPSLKNTNKFGYVYEAN